MASNDASTMAMEHGDDVSEIGDAVVEALTKLRAERQFVDYSPPSSQLLGPFSVACLFLNRTIGSGIYTSPAFVLEGTRSLGASLILWVLGAVLALCSLLVWLEFGLSVPLQEDHATQQKRNTPRSGGEKNFLEYVLDEILKAPRLLATCMYGIMFLILGNLAGNALFIGQLTILAAKGTYPEENGHLGPADGRVVGIAIAALTLSVLLHVFSRRGGIILNNIFAVVKVLLLVVVIVLGFMNLGFARSGSQPEGWGSKANNTMIGINFDRYKAFTPKGHAADGASVIGSFLYITYAYSGYYQVFYVLSEVATPRATVPKATFFALGLTTILYILANISYWLVLDVDDYITGQPKNDLAVAFFNKVLGPEIGQKVMCSLLVISVFGNLLTMSFVAGRVKQEIAKEGILPFSRFFAQGRQTPWSWLKTNFRKRSSSSPEPETERAPITGLFLHWISTMICILTTCWIYPLKAYSIWVTLYGFSIRLVVPICVSASLIYLKLSKTSDWRTISAYNCGLIPALVTFSVLMTVFWAGFAKPAVEFTSVKPHYVLPLIALTSMFWGVIWWSGIRIVELWRQEHIVATRTAFIERRPNGEYVQVAEIVDIEWETTRLNVSYTAGPTR